MNKTNYIVFENWKMWYDAWSCIIECKVHKYAKALQEKSKEQQLHTLHVAISKSKQSIWHMSENALLYNFWIRKYYHVKLNSCMICMQIKEYKQHVTLVEYLQLNSPTV